jgi:hypothetical protein
MKQKKFKYLTFVVSGDKIYALESSSTKATQNAAFMAELTLSLRFSLEL